MCDNDFYAYLENLQNLLFFSELHEPPYFHHHAYLVEGADLVSIIKVQPNVNQRTVKTRASSPSKQCNTDFEQHNNRGTSVPRNIRDRSQQMCFVQCHLL